MPGQKSLFVLTLIFLYSFLGQPKSYAQPRIWVGNGTFSNNSNWNPAGPLASNDELLFSGLGNDKSNNNLGTIVRFKKVVFSGTLAQTIQGSQNLRMRDASSSFASIVNQSNVTQTITCPVIADETSNQMIQILTTGTGRLDIKDLMITDNSSLSNSIRFAGFSKTGMINISGDITEELATTDNKYLTIGVDEFGNYLANTVVVFSGKNTYRAPVFIYAGSLRFTSKEADGAFDDNLIEIAFGASLEVESNITLSGKRMRINGNGVSGNYGAIRSNSGNNTLTRDIFLNGNSTITNNTAATTFTIDGKIGKATGANCNLTFTGNGNFSVNAPIGSSAGTELNDLIKTGTGTLTLNSQVKFTGKTQVTAGTILVGAPGIFPADGTLYMNGGTFNMNNQNVSLGSLVLNNNSTINLGSTANTLSFTEAAGTWNSTRKLTITGWEGTRGTSGTKGRIFFPDPTSLTPQQLSQVVFTGFCDGAMFVGNELVPATLPFLRTVSSVLGGANSAYVGDTVTVTGCGFETLIESKINGLNITPFVLTDNGNNDMVTFTFPDVNGGLVSLRTSQGTSTNNISLVSLGFININPTGTPGDWETPATWLGNNVPPAEKQVTIRSATTVKINAPINNLNSLSPPVNAITLRDGAFIHLQQDNVGNSNTFIWLGNSTLRFHSLSTNTPVGAQGYSQTLGPLEFTGNTNANLSLGTSGVHEIRFQPSNSYTWGAVNRTMTIYNWEGSEEGPGTRGRIFFGTNDTGLTSQQLRQIRWANPLRCPGAILLPGTGELSPANIPYIANVFGTPGGSFNAYIGSTVRIDGCNFSGITSVKVGGISVPFVVNDPDGSLSLPPLFDDTGDEYIEFEMTAGLPDGLVEVQGAGYGITVSSLLNLGYITIRDGGYNGDTIWTKNIIPTGLEKVTIAHDIKVPVNISYSGRITVGSTGKLTFENASQFTVNEFVNSGTFNMGDGFLVLNAGGVLTNTTTGVFNRENGTVIFTNGGTITGPPALTSRISFNNLTIQSGTLNLPNGLSLLPVLYGSLRLMTTSAPAFNVPAGDGRKAIYYADGSSLVYAMGGNRTRFNEWNPEENSVLGLGAPWHVTIENGTILKLQNGAPYAPTWPAADPKLHVRGNLTISNGTINQDLFFPLKVNGNVEIGSSITTGNLMLRYDLIPNAPTPSEKNGYLILEGNLLRNSGSTLTDNGRKIRFEGDDTSTIATTTGIDTALNLHYVQISKAAQNLVILKCPLNIVDSIDMVQGYLKTVKDTLLTLLETGIFLGGGPGSFVDGPMVRQTVVSTPSAADFEFKIGKEIAGNFLYRPVWIANLQHNGNTAYQAEVFETDTKAAPFDTDPGFIDPMLIGVWKNNWWEVKRLPGGLGSARVGLYYVYEPTPTDYIWTTNPPGTGASAAVAKYIGDPTESWTFTRSTGQFSDGTGVPPNTTWKEIIPIGTSGLIYSALQTSFSPFTVGFGATIILPLHLLQFQVTKSDGSSAYIKWVVDDETDLKHFELEYSTDGAVFKKIATITSRNAKEYDFNHRGLAKGVHYYRLKMVDKDAKIAFSRIEFVQLGVNETLISGLNQNPVQGGQAFVKVYSARNQHARVRLFDMSGRMVLAQKLSLISGHNQANVSVTILPAGRYNMLFQTEDGVSKTIPLIKF